VTGLSPAVAGDGFIDFARRRFRAGFAAWLGTCSPPAEHWGSAGGLERHLGWQRAAAEAGYGAMHCRSSSAGGPLARSSACSPKRNWAAADSARCCCHRP
jgi:hypothetical protein